MKSLRSFRAFVRLGLDLHAAIVAEQRAERRDFSNMVRILLIEALTQRGYCFDGPNLVSVPACRRRDQSETIRSAASAQEVSHV